MRLVRAFGLVLAATAAVALPASAAPGAAATQVYWSDANNGDGGVAGIWHANPDGTGRQALPGTQYGPWALDTDSANGKIYWARNDVMRANLDGSAVESVTTLPLNAIGIAVDTKAGKVYWVDSGAPFVGIPAKLERANLDGTAVETLRADLQSPREVAVDPQGGKVYWTDVAVRSVLRANLDGSGLETVAAGLSFPSAIALDPASGHLYWGDGGHVYRSNLDGSNRQLILNANTLGLAVDEVGGKLYFADFVLDTVERANLDGSAREVLTSGQLDTPWGITLVTAALDVSPPETSITGGPADGSLTNETRVEISFSGEDDLSPPGQLTFRCELDGSPTSCSSPFRASGLADGSHSFTVSAIDAAGNADLTPAAIEWTVDATPPVATAALEPIGSAAGEKGRFVVRLRCADAIDPNPSLVGDINGVTIADGAFVELKRRGEPQDRFTGYGVLKLTAPSLLLTVRCADDAENASSASVEPVLPHDEH